MRAISTEERRSYGSQIPAALWVAAAPGRLHRRRSSTMSLHSLRRGFSLPARRRSQRGSRDSYHGLLGRSELVVRQNYQKVRNCDRARARP